MHKKIKPFDQHLYHDIEDEVASAAYLERSLPLIGEIVMYFNGLEKGIESILCEEFTDRTDAKGLIALKGLQFISKVEMFARFQEYLKACSGNLPATYDGLVAELRAVADLRNQVIHADWESTDQDGYTYVRLHFSRQGMVQEYVQFSVESLGALRDRILVARGKLYEYWHDRTCQVHGRDGYT